MEFDKIIRIQNKNIGGSEAFVIAEIGSNHNQDIKLAYELIDAAAECGADAVKFQSIKPEELYNMKGLNEKDKELLKQIELSEEWYKGLNDYCRRKNIIFFSAPTYLDAIDILVQNDVKLMKIASPQTYGFPELIRKVGETNLPTIMSTGYCHYREIERAVNLFKDTGNKKLMLLHCIAGYPTPVENANLHFIDTLSKMFGAVTGFSDHTLSYHIAVAAVCMGAKVIEKHFTLSRKMEGPDHFFSLEYVEFKEMVKAIRDVEKAFGESCKKELMPFEQRFRNEIEMKLCARISINEGEVITSDKIRYLRNKEGLGITAWQKDAVIGRKAKRRINKDEFIEDHHVSGEKE